MSERDLVWHDLYIKFRSLQGVGDTIATKCANSAMTYLDSLVQNQAGSSPRPGEQDEDGVWCMKRPDFIPVEYRYIYWNNEIEAAWVHHNKPIHYDGGNYNCDDIDGVDGYEECPIKMLYTRSDSSREWVNHNLPNVRVEDRIRRLVD